MGCRHRREPRGGEVGQKRLSGKKRRDARDETRATKYSYATRALRLALAQTATVATFVGPAVFPGLDARSAVKVLLWGTLVSAVWQHAASVV